MREGTLTEKHWQIYTAATAVIAVLVSVYCLSEDITAIFVHLYYIPIIIASYRYRERGVLLSLFLVMVFLLLVFFYFPGDIHVMIEGAIRGFALMAIAVIISVLSGRIQSHVDALHSEIDGHKKTEEALRQSESRYMELSITDDLTGLYNPRHFYHLLQAEIERTERYGRPLSLLLLDIDDFKHFNDTYGHMEGDRVLERIGATIQTMHQKNRLGLPLWRRGIHRLHAGNRGGSGRGRGGENPGGVRRRALPACPRPRGDQNGKHRDCRVPAGRGHEGFHQPGGSVHVRGQEAWQEPGLFLCMTGAP